jgi:hypothetical protein
MPQVQHSPPTPLLQQFQMNCRGNSQSRALKAFPCVALVFQRSVLSTVRRENDEVSNCEQQFADCPLRLRSSNQLFEKNLMTAG